MADLLAPLREFNDSTVGVYLGSVLHTLGAIAFLGGLVGYVAWHRALVRGHHNRRVLDGATALTYLAIVVNLLGGFMRTFQTGHPHLWEFAESGWVRAIAVKHLFLFLGMGFMVVLLERVAPRLVRAHKVGELDEGNVSPTSHSLGVLLAAFAIVMAAGLGAATQVFPGLAPDAGAMADGTPTAGRTVSYHNATGTLNNIPPSSTPATGTFVMPPGTIEAEAVFTFSPEQFTVAIQYDGPGGTSSVGSAGRVDTEFTGDLAGQWTYTISSQAALNVQYTLTIRMVTDPAAANATAMPA